ncbi:MAG: phenylalanine--tRNA ligase subunit beta, partial [Clostridia bacterium]|nr:phenylalanine--tRNA ligase subunit beta [Clostridia bacterium]
VLLELGQPMHAFDLRTLDGREIVVRRAKDGEKIKTLDGNEFKLSGENLVICDSKKPSAIAGVMGGFDSEIKDDTSEVLFEAAKFARDSVRKTARSLGQHTDSSSLFEKGVNEYTTERAMCRALNLIEKLGCGTVTDLHIDVTTKNSNLTAKKMTVEVEKINALLGITVPTENMVKILKSLGFGVKLSCGKLDLVVPRWREDIDGFPDIAEEVIRLYGYDHVHSTFLPTALITNGGYNDEQKAENKLKRKLVEKGMYEISTYSFYSAKDLDMLHIPSDAKERKAIKILNPISEELSIMRTTMAPSMLNVIVRNLRRGNMEGKLFELAKIYLPKELPLKNFPEERATLCLGSFGKTSFWDLKGICENIANTLNTAFEYAPCEKPFLQPGKTAEITCEGKYIGYVGVLAPTVCEELAIDRTVVLAELDYAELKKCAKPFRYKPIPKFPEVTRDLALLCSKEITCGEIKKEIYAACKYVSSVILFDVYEGAQVDEGKKSMAFNLTFTPRDEAIEDKVDGYVKKILNNLKYKLNIELR